MTGGNDESDSKNYKRPGQGSGTTQESPDLCQLSGGYVFELCLHRTGVFGLYAGGDLPGRHRSVRRGRTQIR